MTTREHDHHHAHHPHAHHHLDIPARMRQQGEDEFKDRRLSRRSFLVVSIASLAGSLLAKFDHALGGFFPSTAEVKRIYIAPDDHTDYMWTADEATYEQVFLEMLDYYLDLADSTASNSPNSQSRWNCDGSLWMWTYEKNRTSAQFNRLINRIRDGHISVPLNALCVCLGGAPAEAVLRGMYYSGRIERQYNIRFPLAYSMENQTLPYGLGALWSGSGAKYSWKGICGCATQVPDAWDRQHDIYWWQGPDGSKILMKWNSMLNGNQSMGGYAEARNPSAVVDYVDGDSNFIARYTYKVIGAFGKGWDDLKTLVDEFVNVAKTKSNIDRQVLVSNEIDFFEDFESTYGNSLPELACTFGNEWELYIASLAEVSARVKRAVEKLHSAEALATLVSLKNISFMNSLVTERNQAWMNLGLYWEHCWTADGNVPRSERADWSRRLASEIQSYVDKLQFDAAQSLAEMIQKSGNEVRFYTFNSLSWTRSDIADLPYDGPTPLHVIDLSSGEEVPSQIIVLSGQQYIRVLADGVPPVGYKVFEVRLGEGQTFGGEPTADANSGVIENEFYRLTIAPRGAITSIMDKQRGNREFARAIDGYSLNDLGAGGGTLMVENAGPVSVTIKAVADGPVKHTTRITLVRGFEGVIIRNEITENFGDVLKWRFGFEIDSPVVHHEEVGAILKARLTTDGGHYSTRNARYDWLTLNRFADVSDGNLGVTLSNADCYFMQLGNSTVKTLDIETPQICPLAGGQVDGFALGIQNQGNDTYFLQRFALQTHASYNAAESIRFAMEHQNPLVVNEIVGGDAYPEISYSLLEISNSNVLLSALKPAEDGISQGIVARVWNLSPNPESFNITFPSTSVASAKMLTHIETPEANLQVSNGMFNDTLTSQQYKTYSFQPSEFIDLTKNHVYIPVIENPNTNTIRFGIRPE